MQNYSALLWLLVDVVSTIKHAHHTFDVDKPGKDSFEHRRAGACEVLVSSSKRWVLMHENNNEKTPCQNRQEGLF